MGTPTGRLATIPSATGAAARLHDDDDTDEASHDKANLPTAHEDGTGSDGTPRSMGRPSSTKPHATGGSGSGSGGGGSKVVPVTVEDVED